MHNNLKIQILWLVFKILLLKKLQLHTIVLKCIILTFFSSSSCEYYFFNRARSDLIDRNVSKRLLKTLKHPSSLYILRSKILSQWAEVIHSARGTLGREWQEARKLKCETCPSHAFKIARRIKYCCLTSVHVRLCAFWPFPRRLLYVFVKTAFRCSIVCFGDTWRQASDILTSHVSSDVQSEKFHNRLSEIIGHA